MKLPDWIWRTNLTGAIALANLTGFGLCLLYEAITASVPGREMSWAQLLALLMIFPLGHLAFGLTGLHSPPFLLIVFVPLNAYFWGFIGQWIRNLYRQNPLRFLQSAGLIFAASSLLFLIIFPFWLRRVLLDPGERDIQRLCIATGAFALTLLAARWCLRRARTLMTLQTKLDNRGSMAVN